MGVYKRQQSPLWCLLAALTAGAVFGACAGRAAAWPLQWAALTALALLLPGARVAAAAQRGFAFGLGWFTVSVWWLYISLHVYGGMQAWVAVPALLAFAGYLAMFALLACAAFAFMVRRAPWAFAPAFALCWTLAEWLRGELFTGFPWAATGYGFVDSPLAAWAALGGVDLVTFLAALGAALVAAALQWRSLRGAVGAALTLAVLLGGGAALSQVQWSVPHGAPITVALIQGNIAQEEKFAQDHLARNLDTHLRLIAQARGDLIVTPETAIPVLPQQLPPDVLPALAAHLQSTGSAALVGIPLERGPGQYTNSVIGMGGEPLYRYDKHHLVPFGEFIPWGFHWFVRLMNIPLGDFERGALDQPSFAVKGQRVAPTICYEDVFGDELRARFTDPAQAPTIIANLTNLAWFGNTVAIAQHLQIARMRSIEFARPSIRATNTGATAVIDAQGRVTQALAPWTRGTLEATVQGRSGLTPYARFGSAWLWAVLLGLVAALALGWRKRRDAPVYL